MAYRYNAKFSHLDIKRRDFVMALIIVGMLIFGINYLISENRKPIPYRVLKQIKFPAVYPSGKLINNVPKDSIKYDSKSNVFSYIYSDGTTSMTVSEQMTPEAFVDVPKAYEKLTENLGEYSSFDSYFGKVSITRPKEFNGDETAVFNSHGVLFFGHETKGSWRKDQWVDFVNELQLIR